MREVVLRERHVGQSLGHVALVFLGKGGFAVLPVAQREHFGEVARGDQAGTGTGAPGQHLQVRAGGHIVLIHTGQTGVGLQGDLVETVGQEAVFILQILGEHAEQLGRQVALAHAVPVVERGHRAPAQVHGGEHMGPGPIQDGLELVPIVHLFERQVLHRRTGDHESVVIVVAERVKRLVELDQMVGADVGGLVRGGLHEVDLHLQRGLGDQAEQLGLRLDLLGHEVEDHQLERADTLTFRLGFLQREDAFRIEYGSGRQAAGDLDRHGSHYGKRMAVAAGTGVRHTRHPMRDTPT